MSYNGAGVFSINTSGQPVVAGTTISAATFNTLTADIATGLSTCLLKDGTQTVTADIPMAAHKFTGLAAGTTTGDSVRYEQSIPGNYMAPIVNSISGDVTLNNTGTYFDGPSVAQGSTGTWFASGTVTLLDSGGSAQFQVKLWDGTTVIASAQASSVGANLRVAISLSGFLASPAGNIRISVKDLTATTGMIAANSSGNSKDSTITAIRVV